ncbi:ATP-binding cassette domain-containing protein [Corallococcus sp. AB018]|uniref:GTPase n=1 Tax=Corallococcus TaxID=83461 RepID=UPI000F8992F4|nr:GTPase [Corallococcus sp. AB018]NPC70955.1 ATP-binding cassette domain-containing protein [Corallococcus exiguus]NPD26481.1 ATP-binding cassette domain-containing protein [Corallococcus exiguus]NRD48510.1 50S ribosome-binding GTPase [Corallococcus exiguus]NRD55254.1 50S ribosome-binding GTPase [Corallococcus exiguus]RUO91621.1 ATP-binding cassette domain-containing protein [Corallococcus sp. AB018]
MDDTRLPDPEALRPLLTDALSLPALQPHGPRLERLLEDYARGVARKDAPLVVALVGATGAGKSTLLNALSGQSLSREGVDRPTSTVSTLFAPEGTPTDELARTGARVVRYTPGPQGLWSGQVFIDTPDLNSVATAHRDVARAALDKADVALVVMHRGSVAEATQVEFLAEFARRRALVFILNFADELSAESRDALKSQVRRVATQHYGLAAEDVPVFAISARAAKDGQDVSGEFGPLLFHLRGLATQAVAARVRHTNALGALEEFASTVQTALNDTDALLAKTRTALDAGLARAAESLQTDFDARLSLAHGHLASEVRRQAAGRFWGPAAWGLRLSLWGASGMGVGALVARRSLPAGLAVAAASTVVDAVRDRTRARAAEVAVVEPFEDDFLAESAARTALAEARSVARTQGLEAERLGVPDVEVMLAELRVARAGAWRYTASTAVAEAVARWWRTARWLVLPLINLPLLALLGHVGYRVVRGYVEGPLLPLEYFLNAGAFFGLLAGAGALLASASLVGAARHAGRAGRGRFVEALAALGRRLGEAVDDGLGTGRQAARRILERIRAVG